MKKICSLGLCLAISITFSTNTFAKLSGHHYSNHKIKIGKNFNQYKYKNKTYFYQNGNFYSPAGHNEAIIVNPPYGMIIPNIPVGYQTYTVNGQEYHIYNNISYVESPNGGYTIVETPPTAPKMHKEQGLTNSDPAKNKYNEYKFKSPDDLSVKIPNNDGTFTLVPLKKTDDGFIGPQGEKYENFPSINDLKKRYTQPQTTQEQTH